MVNLMNMFVQNGTVQGNMRIIEANLFHQDKDTKFKHYHWKGRNLSVKIE